MAFFHCRIPYLVNSDENSHHVDHFDCYLETETNLSPSKEQLLKVLNDLQKSGSYYGMQLQEVIWNVEKSEMVQKEGSTYSNICLYFRDDHPCRPEEFPIQCILVSEFAIKVS